MIAYQPIAQFLPRPRYDQHRFPEVGIVDPVGVGVPDARRLRLAVAARERDVDDARGHGATG
jgi:hypothetical protein